ATDEGTRDAIEDVVEAVAVRPEKALVILTVYRAIGDERHLDGIPVVSVGRSGLEIPEELAGAAVERDHRVGIEIGASAGRGVEVRPRPADSPVEQIADRIVGAGHPGAGTARAPGVALPGVMSGLSGVRDREEAPAQCPRPDIVSGDVSASLARRRRDADNHEIPVRKRGPADPGAGIWAY